MFTVVCWQTTRMCIHVMMQLGEQKVELLYKKKLKIKAQKI